MSKRLHITPVGIPCEFADLPPGLFMSVEEPFGVGIKNEYEGTGYNEAGEFWCGRGLVMPCTTEVQDEGRGGSDE